MQSQPILPLIKYTRPSSYDFEPYLTQWVFNEDTAKEVYIQMSQDEERPHWERAGSVLECAFYDFLPRKEFMEECLRLFKYKQEDPLLKITEIIREQQR
jgi:hypothetical protein